MKVGEERGGSVELVILNYCKSLQTGAQIVGTAEAHWGRNGWVCFSSWLLAMLPFWRENKSKNLFSIKTKQSLWREHAHACILNGPDFNYSHTNLLPFSSASARASASQREYSRNADRGVRSGSGSGVPYVVCWETDVSDQCAIRFNTYLYAGTGFLLLTYIRALQYRVNAMHCTLPYRTILMLQISFNATPLHAISFNATPLHVPN